MASDLPLILIPPSEGKAGGGSGACWQPGSMAVDLDGRRARVAAALRQAMRSNAEVRSKLLGVTGEALRRATSANRQVMDAPTLPAMERYTGVLYAELDVATLGARRRRVLDASVLIVSGLWGLVAPADPVPEYRLKMSARLGPLGTLSRWWGPALGVSVAAAAVGRRVWNLLPGEHDTAVGSIDVGPDAASEVLRVRFAERHADGTLRSVTHWNKLLKGSLVRHLTAHPTAGIDELADWDHPLGYRLDRSLTTTDGGVSTVSLVRVAPS